MIDRHEDEPGALRRLDLFVVPVVQRRARAVARRARVVGGRIGAPVRAVSRWETRLAGGRLLAAVWPRRSELLLLTVTLAVLASAVHYERYPDLAERARAEAAAARRQTVRQAGTAPGGALPGTGTAVVGAVTGTSPAAYIQERQAVLDAAPGDQRRIAVVSFDAFLDGADVQRQLATAERLDGDIEVHRAQYRLPDADARPLETEVVAGGLADSIERVLAVDRAAIVAEEREVAELLASGTVEDEGFRTDLESRAEELKTVRNVLDSGGAVIFAVVVEARVAALRALQATTGVRLVDLAPPEAAVDGSVFYGLLPDDRDVVSYGAAGDGGPALGDG